MVSIISTRPSGAVRPLAPPSSSVRSGSPPQKSRVVDSSNVSSNGNSSGSAPSVVTVNPLLSGGHVFECSEESALFSRGIRKFLQRAIEAEAATEAAPTTGATRALIEADEMGAGDGKPVCRALAQLGSDAKTVRVTSYDLCPVAAATARRNAASASQTSAYNVQCGDFFSAAAGNGGGGQDDDGAPPSTRPLLLANPPYIPAPSADGLLLPGLFGGRDGADVTRRLLALPRYGGALLVVAGVAAPRSVLAAARRAGYRVRAFEAERLPFGTYTRQPVVREWIDRLEGEGTAHTLSGDQGYVCAVVAFERVAGKGDGSGHSNGNGNGNGRSAADGVEARLLEALTAKHWEGGPISCSSE